ncbi:MAG: hypothetical protein ACRDLE_10705 [Gaiellaceae bacterium]
MLGAIAKHENLWIIADEYSTPPAETFEENVRDWVNRKLKAPGSVAGVCRMRSSGVDLLQMVDLLLGAVVYEHKAQSGIVSLGSYKPKVRLLERVREAAGVSTFIGGYRDARLNIVEYNAKAAK